MDTTRIEPLAVHILYDIGFDRSCLSALMLAEHELREIFHSEEVWKDIVSRLDNEIEFAVYTPYDIDGSLKYKTLCEYLTETVARVYPRNALDKKDILEDMFERFPRWCANRLYRVNTAMNFQTTLDNMISEYIKYTRPFVRPYLQERIIKELGFVFKEYGDDDDEI